VEEAGRAARCIARDDADYPRALLLADSPPGRVWVQGDLSLLDRPSAGIIGARKPSRYGLGVAHDAARELAAAGVVIVSGLAEGLDSRAHRGALDAGGATIGVLGTGLDVAYPAHNAELQEEVKRRGLVMSEYPPHFEPKPWQFVQRNRLIAALSRVLVVVEGRIRSGTANTAQWMQQLGREIFAVPGRIGDPMSEGPNNMIRDGAHPYLHPNDVLRLLQLPLLPEEKPPGNARNPEVPTPGLRGAEAAVFDILGRTPIHVDAIATRCELDAGMLLAALSSLEMQGLVEQHPGKRFALAS